MKRKIDKIEWLMDSVSRNVLKVVFLIILVASLAIKAMYSFADAPYFENNNWIDWLMAIGAAVFYGIIIIKRDWIQEKINYKYCFMAFILMAVIYIILVPLIPFSDMAAIYKGAVDFSTFNFKALLENDYWSVFPGNILLAAFWGILLIPLPKCLLTVKVVNALLVYIIAMLTRKVAKELGVKYYNLAYIVVLTFLPLFIYINHVYFDLPVIVLCMCAVYLYVKQHNIIGSFILLGIGRYLRQSVSIFMLAIFIVELNNIRKKENGNNIKKELLKVICALAIFLGIGHGFSKLMYNEIYNGKDIKAYPAWNQIYIGINEAEFGFMDGDFSYDRSLDDIIERVEAYGPKRMAKILTKKTFWLWSQGTYQAERYGFGNDVVNPEDKFEYETIVTGHLLNSGQILRKVLNSLMRAQYLFLFAGMIYTFWKERDMDKYRLFYYIIFATFLSMLFYELKSRYILQLAPLMVIFAIRSITKIDKKSLKCF